MIVGTAGHIDHGKTSLVRQLAGVDGGKAPHSGTTPIRGEVPEFRHRSSSTKSNLLTMTLRACS
jgi:translation elongation factor EF-Tu-like GTPase